MPQYVTCIVRTSSYVRVVLNKKCSL